VIAGGRSVLREMREMIELSMGELRTLSYVLHPPLLEECGLSAALREYVRGFAQRSGIRVAVELSSGLERLAPAVENALFRVLQESLTNVHRHSGSSVARIRLYRAGNRLVLSVADRGRGIGTAQIGGNDGPVSLGVGIPGMRARLRQFDGDVTVRSRDMGYDRAGACADGSRPRCDVLRISRKGASPG
jgi:two-component system NarL family sensor kinase